MIGLLFFHLFLQPAQAIDIFPYSTRTRNYSGWNSTIQGDVTALGMGGATVAIPSSISGAQINPAGFAMVTASVSAQILSNSIEDRHIQPTSTKYNTNQWGLSVNPPPWGFGILYYSPSAETGTYLSPNTGNKLDTAIAVREVRAAVAHAFFDNRLSLGVSLGVAKAVRELGPYSYNNNAFDFEMGALYILPGHYILGASFVPQNTIHPSDDAPAQVDMPGFNQAVIAPAQTTIGVAWEPNRFFKAGFSLSYISKTLDTALLSDQKKTVGSSTVFEPRLGANYVFAELTNLKLEYAMGTYFEPSRITGEQDRLHGTMGLEVEPWFLNIGIGLDLAQGYQNVLIAVNLDIVRTVRVLGIIPADPVPPYHGFLPPMTEVSPDGLPDGMTHGETKQVAPPNLGDIKNIITDIPVRIRERLSPTLESHTPSKKKNKIKAKTPEDEI